MSQPARRRALFLTPELPSLGHGGGGLRSASLLEYLKRGFDVDVVTFTLREHSKSRLARAARNLGRLIRGKPPLFDRFSGYEEQIRPRLAAGYDLGVVEHFWCASYADLLHPMCGRLVLDLHNIESALARSHAQAQGGAAGWVHARFARMYEDLEARWLPKFDTLLVTSEDDRARVRHPDVRVFPNAIPLMPLPDVPEEDAVIFSGNLEYHPNIEAVRWFAREVWPRLDLPEWRLIGRNAEAVARLVADVPRVRVIGPVEDAIAALAAARVCVVPLLSGSGTRFKILEAWAAGRAVVSTTIGAEGLGARGGEHLLIADTPEDFAAAVQRLWGDPGLRERLGHAGRALLEERFTWPAAWGRLEETGGL